MTSDKRLGNAGKLYVCATPIGNLKDITLRALETLQAVDLIAAEDTRRTRKLLTHYGIKKRLVSFHEHNEAKALPELVERLLAGSTVAQVSDAGMPGIADPGHRLIRACLQERIPVEVLPGPSALLTAAVLSGLPTDDIRFLGFMPRKSEARRKLLEDLKEEPSSIVFYESPHRLKKTLADIGQGGLRERPMFIGRELTKLFEEQLRGAAGQLLDLLADREDIKGELVLVIAGAKEPPTSSPEEIAEAVQAEIGAGQSKSEAIRVVAERLKVSRRRVYEIAHKTK
jgi:16S rRNA (cytidine1402-2'-O)-methyltransferase